MTTNKLRLPEITDNMTADVVRDINALAQAVDESAQKEIPQGSTAPTTSTAGELWIDTTTAPNVLKRYDGSAWVNVGALPPVDSVNGETGEVMLSSVDVGAASSTEFAAHQADDTKHITSTERSNWNNKAEGNHTHTASNVGAIPSSDKGSPNGVATLDSGGDIPSSQLGNVPEPDRPYETGTYVGNGNNSYQTINVGFTPSAVIVTFKGGFGDFNSAFSGFAVGSEAAYGYNSSQQSLEIVSGGFRVYHNYSEGVYLNADGSSYNPFRYIAFK